MQGGASRPLRRLVMCSCRGRQSRQELRHADGGPSAPRTELSLHRPEQPLDAAWASGERADRLPGAAARSPARRARAAPRAAAGRSRGVSRGVRSWVTTIRRPRHAVVRARDVANVASVTQTVRRGVDDPGGPAARGRTPPAGDRPPTDVSQGRGRLPPRRSRRVAAPDRQGTIRRADHDPARRDRLARRARRGRGLRRARAALAGIAALGDRRVAGRRRDALRLPRRLRRAPGRAPRA